MKRRRNGMFISSCTAGHNRGLEVGFNFVCLAWQKSYKTCGPFCLWGVGGMLQTLPFNKVLEPSLCLGWLEAKARNGSCQRAWSSALWCPGLPPAALRSPGCAHSPAGKIQQALHSQHLCFLCLKWDWITGFLVWRAKAVICHYIKNQCFQSEG